MKNVITRLLELLAEVPPRLSAFSGEETSLRPAPGKWSKKEILGHLCDSALHNLQRFTYAPLSQGPYTFPRYPQVELVGQNDYQHLPLGQITELWASLNRQITSVLKRMTEADFAHTVYLPDGQTVTLGWLIQDYLAHLEHHLRQIFPQGELPAPALPARWQVGVEEAIARLSTEPEGKTFVTLLERGKMYVELYAPQGTDFQKPHDQDELYVVISGSGTFYNHGERRPFSPGDVLFVPAGVEHRFEGFTADFKTWVIFY